MNLEHDKNKPLGDILKELAHPKDEVQDNYVRTLVSWLTLYLRTARWDWHYDFHLEYPNNVDVHTTFGGVPPMFVSRLDTMPTLTFNSVCTNQGLFHELYAYSVKLAHAHGFYLKKVEGSIHHNHGTATGEVGVAFFGDDAQLLLKLLYPLHTFNAEVIAGLGKLCEFPQDNMSEIEKVLQAFCHEALLYMRDVLFSGRSRMGDPYAGRPASNQEQLTGKLSIGHGSGMVRY